MSHAGLSAWAKSNSLPRLCCKKACVCAGLRPRDIQQSPRASSSHCHRKSLCILGVRLGACLAGTAGKAQASAAVWFGGNPANLLYRAMLSAQKVVEGPLLVSGFSDINGSVLNDTIVQRNCSLHIRGNLKGSLTIEPGGNVIVEGSVDGKVLNRGGKLVVNNRAIAQFVRVEGPPEAEAGGVLRINLNAIACNWEALAKRVAGECAAVVKADAYGCGIDPVTATLAEAGCKTFLSPILQKPNAFARVLRSQPFMFSMGCTPAPGRSSRRSMRDRSSTALSKWPNGTSSSRQVNGPAVWR